MRRQCAGRWSACDAHKAAQDRVVVDGALETVRAAAMSDTNLLPPMREALRAGATLGQIANTLRALFGEYRAVSYRQ